MVHFVAGMLGEFDVQTLFAEAERLHAVAAQRPGKLEAQGSRAAAADIAHQHRHRRRLPIDRAPHAACAELADGDADAADIDAHHVGVGRR
jgi:hypothetical protein